MLVRKFRGRLKPVGSCLNRLYRGLLGCALLGLWGCGNTPERAAQPLGFTPPPQWTATATRSASAPQSWVDSFADPKLSTLIRNALTHNYDLQALAARVEAARAQAVIDGAGRWPQLGFAPSYQRAKVRDAGYGSTEFGAFEALFTLEWEVDLWGRLRSAQQAAVRDAEASAAEVAAARLSLAARVAQTYFELVEARRQVEVAEQSIRERRAIVELVRGRFARGLTRGLDLRLALTDLNHAEAQLADVRNQAQSIARRLDLWLGRYPQGQAETSAQLPDPPAAPPTGLPSELVERRPDLQSASLRLQAADARVDSARKALLPRIALTAAGGMRSAALAELADPRAIAWNLAAGLLQPIFTGGRLQGQIRLNEAQAVAALHQYRGLALQAFREVEHALAAETQLREQERALREAVAQTQESRKLAVHAYRHGYIEILTLLDSYRGTLNTQSEHLAVQRQLLNNRIALYLALGGGF